ncbi:MAG: hypothetical protein GX365_07425 [Clostridiales bacterium]|nr:hypothetical protein [Clostridiales bacterium]
MLDIDIGYSVIVSRVKLNALRRLVEKHAFLYQRMTERYSELAEEAEARQDWSSKRYWDGVVSTMQDATKMVDEILDVVQALTTDNEDSNEKEGASEDAPLKKHQPYYTTSAS